MRANQLDLREAAVKALLGKVMPNLGLMPSEQSPKTNLEIIDEAICVRTCLKDWIKSGSFKKERVPLVRAELRSLNSELTDFCHGPLFDSARMAALEARIQRMKWISPVKVDPIVKVASDVDLAEIGTENHEEESCVEKISEQGNHPACSGAGILGPLFVSKFSCLPPVANDVVERGNATCMAGDSPKQLGEKCGQAAHVPQVFDNMLKLSSETKKPSPKARDVMFQPRAAGHLVGKMNQQDDDMLDQEGSVQGPAVAPVSGADHGFGDGFQSMGKG
ncbi:hypothetical protein U1Q18_025648 [Sarracenia purpurea var. burkii]